MGAGAECPPPPTSEWEIYAYLPGRKKKKKRQGKNKRGKEKLKKGGKWRRKEEKFLLTYWENRGKVKIKEARKKWKRGKNGEEKKKNCKREGEKLKMEDGKFPNEERTFFFFPFNFSK